LEADEMNKDGKKVSALKLARMLFFTSDDDEKLISDHRWLYNLLSTIASLLVSVPAILLSFGHPQVKLVYVIAAMGAFVFTLVIFSIYVRQVRKGPSRVATLRIMLRNSYLGSLDNSPLNPNKSKGEDNAGNHGIE
jgi:hypothetical protein